MYKILVPVDDVERAAQQVDIILDMPLQTDGIQVAILHVFTDNPEGASVVQLGSVREAREKLTDSGMDVELLARSGTPATEIVEEADEYDADLIVLAGRSRSPTGKAVFGSTAQQVILGTERSVVTRSIQE